MPYIDGLPLASSVSVNDMMFIGQGVVPGYAGNAVSRTISVGQFMAIAFPQMFNSLPTTLPATAGVLWNNGGFLSLS